MPGEAALPSIEEVHIAPLGFEFDRIRLPVEEYGADRVYLLRGEGLGERPEYHGELESRLSGAGVEVTTHSVDLEDIYDVLGVTTTIIDRHQDDIVRVNVSSGPKLAAVGAALACMATDAIGYHVHPESHVHPTDESPRTTGMTVAEQLPSYPLETPTADQVRVLEHIAETRTETYTPKKSDLIAFAEDEELTFMQRADPANDKAKFALLNNRIIDPLLEWAYIEIEPVGRTKQVVLTETGENALRAFRHMV